MPGFGEDTESEPVFSDPVEKMWEHIFVTNPPGPSPDYNFSAIKFRPRTW